MTTLSGLLAIALSGVGLAPAMAAPAACQGVAGNQPPAYYAIDLVPTGRVPGARTATGIATVTSAPSPFGVALTVDGEYRQRLALRVDGLLPSLRGPLAVWVTTTDVDQVRLLGVVDPGGELHGEVAWNKFLVVVTLEHQITESATAWSGPIVLRGASRSGRMHTMAGHGPYQGEPCVKYGY